mmetsp:Transcript_64466/g.94427  ORF Transcript_64466/g.94427 Transcript_64466/m.94427 type:complete len:295 (+) Transcript_64466:706-1590(+)
MRALRCRRAARATSCQAPSSRWPVSSWSRAAACIAPTHRPAPMPLPAACRPLLQPLAVPMATAPVSCVATRQAETLQSKRSMRHWWWGCCVCSVQAACGSTLEPAARAGSKRRCALRAAPNPTQSAQPAATLSCRPYPQQPDVSRTHHAGSPRDARVLACWALLRRPMKILQCLLQLLPLLLLPPLPLRALPLLPRRPPQLQLPPQLLLPPHLLPPLLLLRRLLQRRLLQQRLLLRRLLVQRLPLPRLPLRQPRRALLPRRPLPRSPLRQPPQPCAANSRDPRLQRALWARIPS